MKQSHYAFFQNRDCEFFPCHTGVPADEFNCLFCYCPLYALGERCPGNYLYLENGVKSCENCVLPHFRDNYSLVIDHFPALAALAAKTEK